MTHSQMYVGMLRKLYRPYVRRFLADCQYDLSIASCTTSATLPCVHCMIS